MATFYAHPFLEAVCRHFAIGRPDSLAPSLLNGTIPWPIDWYHEELGDPRRFDAACRRFGLEISISDGDATISCSRIPLPSNMVDRICRQYGLRHFPLSLYSPISRITSIEQVRDVDGVPIFLCDLFGCMFGASYPSYGAHKGVYVIGRWDVIDVSNLPDRRHPLHGTDYVQPTLRRAIHRAKIVAKHAPAWDHHVAEQKRMLAEQEADRLCGEEGALDDSPGVRALEFLEI